MKGWTKKIKQLKRHFKGDRANICSNPLVAEKNCRSRSQSTPCPEGVEAKRRGWTGKGGGINWGARGLSGQKFR